jgi:hypothetical protein
VFLYIFSPSHWDLSVFGEFGDDHAPTVQQKNHP